MKLITIEEAVGLMINLDYIPTDFTLLDMTEAFADEAEANYKQHRTDEFKLTKDICTNSSDSFKKGKEILKSAKM